MDVMCFVFDMGRVSKQARPTRTLELLFGVEIDLLGLGDFLEDVLNDDTIVLTDVPVR